MTFQSEREREEIRGVSGGILPVYEFGEADQVAACSCQIGTYMMDRYGLPRYDSLPGTSPKDTKHDLVMAHAKELSERLAKLQEIAP